MGRLYPLLVLLIAAGPPGCAAQQDLVTKASSGPSLHQAPDGSWLQAVELQGGASGLRDAFARQMVTVDCPSSQVRSAVTAACSLGVLERCKCSWACLATVSFRCLIAEQASPATHPSVLQLFEVTISSSHPESGTSWQRVRQCGTQMPEGASTAAISSCTISAPAAVASTIVIRQPGDLSDRVAGPEPCTLTLQAGTSPHLLLATLLGAALLLRGQRWCRTRAGAALTRICCVGLPLLTALAGTALLASLAVTSTAGMEWVLAQLPVQPPK